MDRPAQGGRLTATAPLRVTYRLRVAEGASIETRALHLAREQTVEIPAGVFAASVEAESVGRVASIAAHDDGSFAVAIDFPVESTGRELPQLLNLLFGNVSLQSGVRIEAIEWPEELLSAFPGPGFGIQGVRELCGAHDRPLTAAALKPMGLSPRELARLAGECALGGIDLVKDDHGLADQTWAPFRERVLRVHERIASANRVTGGSTVYAPNVTAPVDRLGERLDLLSDLGIRAALVAPFVLGLDQLRALSASSDVAWIAHPAMGGGLIGAEHGFRPELLFGDLLRLAGADAVVFPNAGGRFPHSLDDCLAIERRLAAPLGGLRRSGLVLGGGVDLAQLERWIPRYAVDTIWLVGGSLYARSDLRAAAAELARAVSTIAPRAPDERGPA